ncbi:unnamed protein product [Clonostachys chloroleuca]|uniref:Uncharacterized protein n=1 Tax=Clonostachys chloroleuca TaxID=1926264 RepID=A0AA35Q1B0_9HYPO|nr:unnamed protein product [Clonostachys chloroleuca]
MTEEHNRRQRIVDAIVFLQLASLLSLAKHVGRAKSTFELVMLADHDVALVSTMTISPELGLPLTIRGTAIGGCCPWPCLSQLSSTLPWQWQQLTNNDALKYLRAPCQSLKQRLVDRKLVHSNVTLASMLLLVTYEVFAGTDRWKRHLLAIHGWIRSRGDCSDLDPFLKNWVCMLDIQAALSLGIAAIPELDPWMEATADHKLTIDALFGCSVRLPKLLSAASRLLVAIGDGELVPSEIQSRADALQKEIRDTRISADAIPLLGLTYHRTAQAFSATIGLYEDEMWRRAIATAEVFRHATHIFVYRIIHGPENSLSPEMLESLHSALGLLTLVPDAVSLGPNLGWCLVVLGTELETAERRHYITSRWAGLHLLGIHSTKNGEKILNEVWNHRDLMKQGYPVASEPWQDIMLRIGKAQIFI